MIITNAKYISDVVNGEATDTSIAILCTIDGQEMSIPLDTSNRHYAEILKQVADGDITIAEAD
tara:strand:+ start:1123 stop:1311 length:189 start_codon:yes stop_codon:yes gene_type:complete